jgi:serine/threonine protein kinase
MAIVIRPGLSVCQLEIEVEMENTNLSGKVIADRYRLVELLGTGGSGSTYRAICLDNNGVEVAIKILSLRHLNDWKQLELFEREAKVLSQLEHPQIPKYLEYFHVDTPENRAFYLVQQLAPGKPLTAWVASGWRGTEAEVRELATQLLGVLQYLHSQSPPLVHRDIKPHNIIRNDDGRIVLVDFGSVQDVYRNTLLKGATVAGTYGYMSPEQFRGAAVPQSDLYGLGATILYLLTHRSPVDLPQARLKLNFRSHVNISESFANWLETILEPNLGDRFATTNDAAIALEAQNYCRKRTSKFNFPKLKAIALVTSFAICLPLIYRYRYSFLIAFDRPLYGVCDAIRTRDIDAINILFNSGVSVDTNIIIQSAENSETHHSVTGSLLDCAIDNNRIDVLKLLLQKGANETTINDSLIELFCRYSYWEARKISIDDFINLLVTYGANINTSKTYYDDGRTPLSYTVARLDARLFKILIKKYQANPHVVDREGKSLWHLIAQADFRDDSKLNLGSDSRLEIANYLKLSTSLDINSIDDNGDTPLHIIVNNKKQSFSDDDSKTYAKSRMNLIDILLSSNAKIDLQNKEGQTPLLIAIKNSDLSTTKLLISRGANVNIADFNGRTPLAIATECDGSDSASDSVRLARRQIVALLLESGADRKLVKNKLKENREICYSPFNLP